MDTTRPKSDPGPVLGPWDLLPLLGAASLLVLSLTLWNRLPEHLPIHFGADGQPNGWAPKSAAPWLMFGFPSAMWVFLAVIGTWAGPSEQTRAALQRRIMAPMRGLTVLGLFILMSLMVLIPIHGQIVFWPVLGTFFALVFLGLGLLVRKGYLHAPEDERQLWRWGVFYVNPEDSRLWVPKRFGLGWTLNFARPLAWVVMVLLCSLPLAILAIPMLKAR